MEQYIQYPEEMSHKHGSRTEDVRNDESFEVSKGIETRRENIAIIQRTPITPLQQQLKCGPSIVAGAIYQKGETTLLSGTHCGKVQETLSIMIFLG